MLPEDERLRQIQLDQEALADMKVARWTPVQHISDRFDTSLAPAAIGALVAKYYYKTTDIVAKSSLIHPAARSIMLALKMVAKTW